MIIKPQIEMDYKNFEIESIDRQSSRLYIYFTIKRNIKGIKYGLTFSKNILRENVNIRNYICDNLYKLVNPNDVSHISINPYCSKATIHVLNSSKTKLKVLLIINTNNINELSEFLKNEIKDHIY